MGDILSVRLLITLRLLITCAKKSNEYDPYLDVDSLAVNYFEGCHSLIEQDFGLLARVHDDALALAVDVDSGANAAEDIHLDKRADRQSMKRICALFEVDERTVSLLSPMLISAGPL